MSKLKNWKEIGILKWENKKKGMVVGIKKSIIKNSGYEVYGQMPNHPAFDLYDVTNGEFFSKEDQAIEQILIWMKEHPDGD